MAMKFLILALFLAPARGFSADSADASSSTANPIRKVVTMLQMMVKKIEAEGVKEKEMYDKFMCYCNTADATLGKSIQDADTKIPQLESDIKAAVEEKAQLESDLTAHQSDRDAANEAMAKATEMREKEAAAYAKEMAGDKADLDSLTKAIGAIEKGLGGSFLQTNAAKVLRAFVISDKVDMVEMDRRNLVSYLEQDDSSPGSQEIIGIMKQLKDEMAGSLKDLMAAEEKAIKEYNDLMSAKKKEVETLTAAIEEKMVRVGELGVHIAQMKNDLEDTQETLGEDTKYLADLGKTCGSKTKEWEAREKARGEELLALADTIKILNDDDALELFKKTLPSASFLQLQESETSLQKRALQMIRSAQKIKGKASRAMGLEFIGLALQGKKAGFEKVIKLMDEMVVFLKKEQLDDDHKKEYCGVQLDIAEDKKKELDRTISDHEKAIAETEEGISTVKDEIKVLEDSIAALDKSVAEATAQRKEENAEFSELMASNTAAKELIEFAKNRMQKFYNPKLAKFIQTREGSKPLSFAQVDAHIAKKDVATSQAAPPPPPAAEFGGAKTEESGGVLAMMDSLIAELAKETTAAELEEKDAQGDYEETMKDSSDMRASDTKDLTDKNSAKAEMEAELQAQNDAKAASTEELTATKDFLQTLHKECDFLLENYAERQTARASEIDAIGKAKAVLNGADFSLVQTGKIVMAKRHLRAH